MRYLVEEIFKAGCLSFGDFILNGNNSSFDVDFSKMVASPALTDLKSVGLNVKDVFVILIRQIEKVEELRESGFRIHYLFTINEFADILKEKGLITEQQNLIVKSIIVPRVPNSRWRLSFGERAGLARNKMASRLFSLMHEKHTNLCVAADLKSMEAVLKLADEIGPYICVLKLHLDCIVDKTDSSAEQLRKKADEHNFIILEDRGLAENADAVSLKYSAISEYTGLVTVFPITGSRLLKAIKNSDGFKPEESGVFVIAQSTLENSYITPIYASQAVELAEEYASLVTGIVCQEGAVFNFPGFIQLTSGVSLTGANGDTEGRPCRTPESVVKDLLADIAVVGHDIVHAFDPAEVASRYCTALWDAYLDRINS